jgi:hypothetical protein
MSTTTGGSGAGAGRLSHWPHAGGGTSSSRISTTATLLPPAGAGADKIDGAVTAMVVTAAVAITTCCGSVAAATLRGASLVVAAVLPVARGAIDERCLVGTDASDLSALAGARGATVGATLRMQK